jgi:hypothetical protein
MILRHPPFDGLGAGMATRRRKARRNKAGAWTGVALCAVAGLSLAALQFSGHGWKGVQQARGEPLAMKNLPGPVVACDFSGWSNDPDPGGLPIRQNPDPQAPPLGRLPPPKVIGADEFAVMLKVTGYKDGWFRIANAAYPDEAYPQGGNTGRAVFSGQGWVPAAMVKATLGTDSLRVAARNDSARKATLSGNRGGFPFTPDVVGVRRLLSCQGTWVEAETEFGTGWVAKVCPRQLSACP